MNNMLLNLRYDVRAYPIAKTADPMTGTFACHQSGSFKSLSFVPEKALYAHTDPLHQLKLAFRCSMKLCIIELQ